jgi:hypothetical protein
MAVTTDSQSFTDDCPKNKSEDIKKSPYCYGDFNVINIFQLRL